MNQRSTASGRLRVAAAIGVNGDVAGKASQLLDAGVDLLVVDTAHGHQQRMIDALSAVRGLRQRSRSLRAMSYRPRECAISIAAGADVVKVGVGPGAMCTTRMMTGVGRPQFSAVLECAAAARDLDRHVWAGRRVRHPARRRAGLGRRRLRGHDRSWFAGTFESPGDLHAAPDGRLYKESFGMASARAVANRTPARTRSSEPARRCSKKGYPLAGCTSIRCGLGSRT